MEPELEIELEVEDRSRKGPRFWGALASQVIDSSFFGGWLAADDVGSGNRKGAGPMDGPRGRVLVINSATREVVYESKWIKTEEARQKEIQRVWEIITSHSRLEATWLLKEKS